MRELVPIIAIICAIGLPVSIPIVYLVFSHRRQRHLIKLHHAERMAAIERGMDPPQFPQQVLGPWLGSQSGLLPGMVWLCVGLALIPALYEYSGSHRTWIWALVPTAVGIAYLVYYFVEGRKEKS